MHKLQHCLGARGKGGKIKADRVNCPKNFVLHSNCTMVKNNRMTCNLSKCKELALMKKGNASIFDRVAGIPPVKDLVLLDVTFQSDTRFNIHVKNKLVKSKQVSRRAQDA